MTRKGLAPLTMLTIVYKIIAKLLVMRLRSILPNLISPQQIGFVCGCNILEIISLDWLGIGFITQDLLLSSLSKTLKKHLTKLSLHTYETP